MLSKLKANHDIQSLIRRPILSSNTTNTTHLVRPNNHNNGVHFEGMLQTFFSFCFPQS